MICRVAGWAACRVLSRRDALPVSVRRTACRDSPRRATYFSWRKKSRQKNIACVSATSPSGANGMAGSAADAHPALLASRGIHAARPYAVCPAWRASDGGRSKAKTRQDFDFDFRPSSSRLGWRVGAGTRGRDAARGEECGTHVRSRPGHAVCPAWRASDGEGQNKNHPHPNPSP